MCAQMPEMTEQALFEEYERSRDEALRNHILEKFLYIAEIVAKKFAGRGVEYDDSTKWRR